MIPPTDRQPAFVLHRRAFRESSVLVELLSRDFGRVGGVVRGAKGSRGQRQEIEPFGELAVTWRGRGELVTVTRSESVQPRRLTGDVLFAGLYVNELLVKTLGREEPVGSIFQRYEETLSSMQTSADIEPALRTFERHLLDELGYGIAFDFDVHSGKPIEREKSYRMVDGEGFREVEASDAAPTPHGSGRLVLSGCQIAAIARSEFADRSVRRAAKQVLRRAIALRLGGRPLTTRRLFAASAVRA